MKFLILGLLALSSVTYAQTFNSTDCADARSAWDKASPLTDTIVKSELIGKEWAAFHQIGCSARRVNTFNCEGKDISDVQTALRVCKFLDYPDNIDMNLMKVEEHQWNVKTGNSYDGHSTETIHGYVTLRTSAFVEGFYSTKHAKAVDVGSRAAMARAGIEKTECRFIKNTQRVLCVQGADFEKVTLYRSEI